MLGSLMKVIRGKVAEASDDFRDANALTILDQEMREARQALTKARDERATIAAERKLQEDKVAGLKTDIATYEGHAVAALDKGEEALAGEVAERIAALEADLATEEAHLTTLAEQDRALAAQIRQIDDRLDNMERQVASVKATEAVQRAQRMTMAHGEGAETRLGMAADSLERLKKKQALSAAKMQAQQEAEDVRTGADLDNRLAEAGISATKTGATSVLERLRAKRGG